VVLSGKAHGQDRVELVVCPVDIAKAVKNETEQQGFRNAYLRDGRATVRKGISQKLTARSDGCLGLIVRFAVVKLLASGRQERSSTRSEARRSTLRKFHRTW
jgi:hypothetical protein